MTEDHGWARPGSGDLPPGWARDQPPPYQPGMPPGQPGARGPAGFGPPPGGPGGPGPGPGGPGWMPPGMRPPAPKPGIVPLRPLGLGELLDGAFTGIRRNPKATLGLSAVLMTIASVAQAVVSFFLIGETTSLSARAGQVSDAEAVHLLGQVGGGLGISLVVSIIATTILTGLLTTVYGRSVLGEFLTMGEAWRLVRPRLWRLLGVTVLVMLIVLAVAAIGFGVPIGIAVAAPNAGTIVLAVLIGIVTILAIVYLDVKLALAVSVVVLENAGAGQALARSYRLTGRVVGPFNISFWRVLVILALTHIIAFLLNGVIQTPFAAGQIPMALSHDPSTGLELLSVVTSTIGTIISTTITTPFIAGVGVLLYVDLRMRREGLDLQLQTAATNPTGTDFATLWQPAHGAGPYAPEEPPYETGGPAPYGTSTPPYGTGPGAPPRDGPGHPPSPGGR